MYLPKNITMRIGDFRVFLSESTDDLQSPKMATEYMARKRYIDRSVADSMNRYPYYVELNESILKKIELHEQQIETLKKMRRATYIEVLRKLESEKKQHEVLKG